MKSPRLLTRLLPLLGVAIFAIVLTALVEELRRVSFPDVLAEARALPSGRVAGALALVVVGYAALASYDVLATLFLGRRELAARAGAVGFVATAVSHNVGLAGLGGTVVRARLYSRLGLSSGEIAKLVAFVAATTWVGFVALGAVTFLVAPPALPAGGGPATPAVAMLASGAVKIAGVAFSIATAGWLVATWRFRAPLHVRGHEIALPHVGIATTQTIVGALEWAGSATALYVLLPAASDVGPVAFCSLFFVAQLVAMASHVPGGIGVFETVMLWLLRGRGDTAEILGSLLVYRAAWYLLPLAVALTAFSATALLAWTRGQSMLRSPDRAP